MGLYRALDLSLREMRAVEGFEAQKDHNLTFKKRLLYATLGIDYRKTGMAARRSVRRTLQ
jgi:hypothetical protein